MPNDSNTGFDVFLLDFITKSNELVSVRQPDLPSQSPAASNPSPLISVDTAGRFIAFASASASLAPINGNRYRSVFVHDLLGGTNVLVSADTNGLPNANGMSSDPSVSGDGRYVVFTSSATDLALGNSNNVPGGFPYTRDVYLRDLQTGITTLVSINASSMYGENSYSPMISANGRYVMFHSTAVIATSTGPIGNGRDNLFLRDLQAGATYALTTPGIMGPTIIPASMTPDGHFVACYSFNSGNYALYVWDSQASRLILHQLRRYLGR